MRNDYYVYVMLDQREKGLWEFNDVKFYHKPFYIGIGIDYRITAHFTPFNLSKKSIKNNIIKSISNSLDELPIFYKIFENLSVDNANCIEVNLIKHFGKIKDKSGILSNLTDGGDGTSGYNHTEEYKETLRKKVYQYNIDGVFIKKWNSLKEVIDFYKISGGHGIRKSIKDGIHCKGCLWSYEYKDKLIPHLKKQFKYKYTIVKDNFKMTFNNKQEIDNFFNRKTSPGNISSCCNNKLQNYLGYKWIKEQVKYI